MTVSPEIPDHRCGYIAILGVPNVGKSTLLNTILESRIAITSDKPQTTRNRLLGVFQHAQAQLIFIDTPGIHNPRRTLNTRMVKMAIGAIQDADLILWVVDVTHPNPTTEALVLKELQNQKRPVMLALNKIDLIETPQILKIIDQWSKRLAFSAIIPVSASKGTQVELLLDTLIAAMPVSPPFFPADMLTDMSVRFIAAEMIREKIFRLTGQEIPYAVAVTIEAFTEITDRNQIRIEATIHVERSSQKGIIIGQQGKKLKEIGIQARKEIERLTGSRVHLNLFVRVQKNWSEDAKALARFGY